MCHKINEPIKLLFIPEAFGQVFHSQGLTSVAKAIHEGEFIGALLKAFTLHDMQALIHKNELLYNWKGITKYPIFQGGTTNVLLESDYLNQYREEYDQYKEGLSIPDRELSVQELYRFNQAYYDHTYRTLFIYEVDETDKPYFNESEDNTNKAYYGTSEDSRYNAYLPDLLDRIAETCPWVIFKELSLLKEYYAEKTALKFDAMCKSNKYHL